MDIVERLREHIYLTLDAMQDIINSIALANNERLEAADEIEKLRSRLEIDFIYDGEGNKVKAPNGTPDGIECRNETIKLQDEAIEKLRTETWNLGENLSEAEIENQKLRAENKESTTLVFDMSAERGELIAENEALKAASEWRPIETCNNDK